MLPQRSDTPRKKKSGHIRWPPHSFKKGTQIIGHFSISRDTKFAIHLYIHCVYICTIKITYLKSQTTYSLNMMKYTRRNRWIFFCVCWQIVSDNIQCMAAGATRRAYKMLCNQTSPLLQHSFILLLPKSWNRTMIYILHISFQHTFRQESMKQNMSDYLTIAPP